MTLTSDSSSDDDIYVTAAARLKALKKKAPVITESPKADQHNGMPDFRSQQSSEPNQIVAINSSPSPSPSSSTNPRSGHNTRIERESSPDVEITVEDDSAIFEKSVDPLNVTNTTSGIDDDNYNVDVKVRWKSREVVRFELRKYETCEKIFQHFAEIEGVPEKHILILRGVKPVTKTDTPASMNLRVIDILEGGIVNTDVATEDQNEDNENICKIKVQMSTKQKIIIDLRMDETFKTVVITCAEKLGVKPSQIKLSFDGDKIAPTDTPESLDLEQEACIDLHVITS